MPSRLGEPRWLCVARSPGFCLCREESDRPPPCPGREARFLPTLVGNAEYVKAPEAACARAPLVALGATAVAWRATVRSCSRSAMVAPTQRPVAAADAFSCALATSH